PRRPAPHCWKPPRTGHAGSPDVTGPVRGGGHVHRCTRADRSPRPEDTQGPTPAPGSSRQWPPNHRPPDPKGTKRSVGATPTATRLAAAGEDSARIAFCRSIPEYPRERDSTGRELPVLPSAEYPGAWARLTEANPAFRLRYAHAHATSRVRWVAEGAPVVDG